MKYNVAVFDLDGTLTDTLADLKNSVNYALSKLGLPERSAEEVRSFVGNGIGRLIYLSVPENTPAETAEKCLGIFKEYYKTHSCIETKPYDGIIEMLEKLKERNVKIAVVTNKIHGSAVDITNKFFGDLVDITVGQSEDLERKPAPDGVFYALEKLGVSKENAVYIGDSEVDCETAKNAEIPCIGVSWGFRGREVLENNGAFYVADSTEEITETFFEI